VAARCGLIKNGVGDEAVGRFMGLADTVGNLEMHIHELHLALTPPDSLARPTAAHRLDSRPTLAAGGWRLAAGGVPETDCFVLPEREGASASASDSGSCQRFRQASVAAPDGVGDLKGLCGTAGDHRLLAREHRAQKLGIGAKMGLFGLDHLTAWPSRRVVPVQIHSFFLGAIGPISPAPDTQGHRRADFRMPVCVGGEVNRKRIPVAKDKTAKHVSIAAAAGALAGNGLGAGFDGVAEIHRDEFVRFAGIRCVVPIILRSRGGMNRPLYRMLRRPHIIGVLIVLAKL
jgi:hypothetical protein